MKGLILNNLYSTEKSVKSSLFLTAVAVVLLLLTKNPMAMKAVAFLPFFLIPVHAFEILKYDAMSGWNKYEIILPVTRKRIVGSKYITFLLLFTFSVLIVSVIVYIFHLFQFPIVYSLLVSYSLRGMGLVLCVAALLYPLTYWLGTEKSDTIMISSASFSFGIFFSTSLMLQMFIGGVEDFDRKFSFIFFILSFILFSISYVISINIYKNKEF